MSIYKETINDQMKMHSHKNRAEQIDQFYFIRSSLEVI